MKNKKIARNGFLAAATFLIGVSLTADAQGDSLQSVGYAAALAVLEADAPASDFVVVEAANGPGVAASALLAGCAENEVLWQRDSISSICTTTCSSDVDCWRDGDRCRVFATGEIPTADAAALADDLDAASVAALDEPSNGLLALCDPFWEIDGSIDGAFMDMVDEPTVGADVGWDGVVDAPEP